MNVEEGKKNELKTGTIRHLDEYIQDHPEEILQGLLNYDRSIMQTARELAAKYIRAVDYKTIANSLFTSLDLIKVEDLYDTSGKTRDGYVEPAERADEMFREVYEPYEREFQRCLKLSMNEQAMQHCMGLLLGLYTFEKESSTEFADWIPDTPHECFEEVLEAWLSTDPDSETLERMDKFIAINCRDWHAHEGGLKHG
ncbi:MAG: hypothetical protein ACP5UZ_08035 [Thermoplasmata archaeon]